MQTPPPGVDKMKAPALICIKRRLLVVQRVQLVVGDEPIVKTIWQVMCIQLPHLASIINPIDFEPQAFVCLVQNEMLASWDK